MGRQNWFLYEFTNIHDRSSRNIFKIKQQTCGNNRKDNSLQNSIDMNDIVVPIETIAFGNT